MKIKLTRALAGHAVGSTLERSTKVAELLIANGAATASNEDDAEHSEQRASNTSKSNTSNTKTKRTRRSQRRDDGSDAPVDGSTAAAADETAGQEGGGTPLPTSPATAG